MKKLLRIIALVTVFAVTAGMFAGCGKTKTALKAGIAEIAGDSYAEQCAGKSEIEITFAERKTINCVAIEADSDAVTAFSVYGRSSGKDVLLARGDTVGSYRFCSFDAFETKSVKLVIDEAQGSYNITSFIAGSSDKVNSAFKVVSYYVCSSLTEDTQPNENVVDNSTDIILFGAAVFDETGFITVENETVLDSFIKKIRLMNSSVNVYINLLGPSGEGETWNAQMRASAELHKGAFKDNRAAFISNIKSLLLELSISGIFFDYEYPTTRDAKWQFSDFLIELRTSLGSGSVIGAALSDWCCSLEKEAIAALDMVEIMSYDSFDEQGRHSTFTAAYKAVNTFIEEGYLPTQLQLGLPLYGRPLDGGASWPSYGDYAELLKDGVNIANVDCGGETKQCYFNSIELLRDKTAYALLTGVSGIMLWHGACDSTVPGCSAYEMFTECINSLKAQ